MNNLLNKKTFLKYVKDCLGYGYISNEFELELENIKEIKNKVIFLNYIKNQLLWYLENKKLDFDLHTYKIDFYLQDPKYIDKAIDIERLKTKKERESRKNKKFQVIFKEIIKKENSKSNYQYLLDRQSEMKEKIDFIKDSLNLIEEKIIFWNEQLEIDKSDKINFVINKNIESINSEPNKPEEKQKEKKTEKLVWLGTLELLRTLFNQLQDKDFIRIGSTNMNDFNGYIANFINKNNSEFTNTKQKKIKWYGLKSELAYLIGELKKYPINILSEKQIWKNAESIFINKQGGNITNLSQSYTKANPKSNNIRIIIEQIKSINGGK